MGSKNKWWGAGGGWLGKLVFINRKRHKSRAGAGRALGARERKDKLDSMEMEARSSNSE